MNPFRKFLGSVDRLERWLPPWKTLVCFSILTLIGNIIFCQMSRVLYVPVQADQIEQCYSFSRLIIDSTVFSCNHEDQKLTISEINSRTVGVCVCNNK